MITRPRPDAEPKGGTLTRSLQPLTVLLVRHARTAWNAERRFLGRTDVPLDPLGEAQADALARRLAPIPLAGVYTSPLARARETARRLGEPVACPALTEMDMGELEGLGGEEVQARFPGVLRQWRDDPLAIRPPGGETIAATQARLLEAFAVIVRGHQPGEAVALVTHQIALATLLCGLLGDPLSEFRRYLHRNTGFSTLAWTGRAELLTFDDAAHLEALGGDPTPPLNRTAR